MARRRCNESLSIPGTTPKILNSSCQKPPTFPPHHPLTFPTFPTSPASHLSHLSHLATLPPTMIALQNNNTRSSLSPHWFLRGGSPYQNLKANSYSPLLGNDLRLLDLSSDLLTIRPLKYVHHD